ncbi:50S ribosomal protein L5 [Rubricoccus marinus]|uniref:Large ribosomal subunit protein uL5 n=1 Tax=Rubricoccus marinus TaxID=716817 RepID=A0A259U1J2_9BACT|nr:50S ribosomal protein L5 [Rubricoccus marinus]OZC03717.1 50S ribosomal protein L5 [Rubricoccus marinus]
MENYTPRLKERYRSEITSALTERFEYANPMQVPRLTKIVINKGIGEASVNKKILDDAVEELRKITGQQPAIRASRKSISNFKLREGMPVGVAVTLRGERMWEFLDRLITLALPGVRDFRGIPDRSFDGRGNYTLGIKEQIIFPEIDIDKVDRVTGLDISFVTTAETDEEAFALLKELGMPFVRREEEETA